ncbi:MAG: EamA family transporter [Chitinophagaceae bacterium]|nr:EamA family transporter [Chitinophagaceae bacterium]
MKEALIKLHIAVFLAGFTGVMGVLISLNEGLLVWYRMTLTVISLFILLLWQKNLQKISFDRAVKLLLIGCLIALHWVCFYGSIKYANVSIGLVCFASTGLFTALLEPLLTLKKFSWVEVLLGCISLVGIYLIFHFDERYRTGIFIGIISAIFAALFTVLNKKNVSVVAPKTMMLYELSGGVLLLTILMPFYLQKFPATHLYPSLSEWGWLLILSWLCTVWAMGLMLQVLKKISAFTVNLSLNLEPVYGIALAFILFHEQKQLKSSFYIGFSLIALSVVLQMIRVLRLKKH